MYAGKHEETKMVTTTSANEYQTLLDAAMKNFLQKRISDRALEESL